MRQGSVVIGLATALLLVVAGSPSGSAESVRPLATSSAVERALPPEFSGNVTVTFDAKALVSNSDMTPGNYDKSHVYGEIRLRPEEGSVSQPFDPLLAASTPVLDVTETMTRYAPDNPCQDYEFLYSPAVGYSQYPAYFGVDTPEQSFTQGHRWGIDLGWVVGARTNGCPGQDGNWPIDMFSELVGRFLLGTVRNTDTDGGRLHLAGTKSVTLTSPAVVRHNKQACASDGVYYEPCITSLDVQMTFDLQRISPKNRASQYPRLTLKNDRRGNDVVLLRTNTPVPHARVTVYRVTKGSGVSKTVGGLLYTDRKGRLRFTLRDSDPDGRRSFIAFVEGTSRVLPGVSTTQSIG